MCAQRKSFFVRRIFDSARYIFHRIIVRIRIFFWYIFYDIQIGQGTDFKDVNYLNTVYGPIKIGKNCQINAFGLAGPIEIGDHVLINHMSDISGRAAKVKIGNNVLIAPRVSILASMHNYSDRSLLIKDQGVKAAEIEIGDDVWIGTGSVIMPGIKIGQGAVIGANSVVNQNIPDYAVAVGIPAKIIKFRE